MALAVNRLRAASRLVMTQVWLSLSLLFLIAQEDEAWLRTLLFLVRCFFRLGRLTADVSVIPLTVVVMSLFLRFSFRC